MLTTRSDLTALYEHKNLSQYYACPNRDTAYNSLLTAINTHNDGHIVLTGDTGVGKTFLLRQFMREANASNFQAIYCPTGLIDFDQLVTFLLGELQINATAPGRHNQLLALKQHIQECAENNSRLVLIIDDAHKLNETLVQQLQNLIQPQSGAFRLIFSGQAALLDRIESWRSRYPLLANILLVHLSCLTSAATKKVINSWVLSIDELEFTADAIEQIAVHSKGRPALINKLCKHTIELALNTGTTAISAATVDMALADLRSDPKDSEELDHFQVIAMNPALLAKTDEQPEPDVPIPDQAVPRTNAFFNVIPSGAMVMLLLALLIPAALAGHWFYLQDEDDEAAVMASLNTELKVSASKQAVSVDNQEPVLSNTSNTAPVQAPEIIKSADLALPTQQAKITQSAIPTPKASEPATKLDEDLLFWGQIKDSNIAQPYTDYLVAFPNGEFAQIAKLRQQRFAKQQQAEIDRLLAKAQAALDKKLLTTPADNNVVKWTEAVLELDPNHATAQMMLQQAIDTYINWSTDKLEQRRLSSAATYLARAETLQQYASNEQASAIEVLSKQVATVQRRAASKSKRVASKSKSSRTSKSRQYRLVNYNRRNDDSVMGWLHQLDRQMQAVGRQIDRKMGTHNRNTVRQRDLRGFSSR